MDENNNAENNDNAENNAGQENNAAENVIEAKPAENAKVESPKPNESDMNPWKEKVDKLELKDYLRDKAPQLVPDFEKIHELKKANAAMELNDVIALHLGRSIIESQGGQNTVINKPINISSAPEVNYDKMSDDELFAQARKELGT